MAGITFQNVVNYDLILFSLLLIYFRYIVRIFLFNRYMFALLIFMNFSLLRFRALYLWGLKAHSML